MANDVLNKASIRALIKERKQQLSVEDKIRLSEKIMNKIEQNEQFRSAQSVLCYWPLTDEVQIAPLLEKYGREKRILLPVVVDESLEMRVYKGVESMQKGRYGIPEPEGVAYKGPVDVILVPGQAFDLKGNRLGRGKAYYDRFLPATTAYKIGVAFRLQIVDSLPVDPWDVPMNEIITD